MSKRAAGNFLLDFLGKAGRLAGKTAKYGVIGAGSALISPNVATAVKDYFDSQGEPENNETDEAPPAPDLPTDVTSYDFDNVPDFGPATGSNTVPNQTPSRNLERDTRSILDEGSPLAKLFDTGFIAQRDRENFKRQLIQQELSQRAGLAKSRERTRREIEKERIDAWARINQQSILRDQAMFQSAATAIASANPSNALARLQSLPVPSVQSFVPVRTARGG